MKVNSVMIIICEKQKNLPSGFSKGASQNLKIDKSFRISTMLK